MVDGTELDAPTGTLVFLDDPRESRGAVAVEDHTIVMTIGGVRGEPFRISPWEYAFASIPAIEQKRWNNALTLLRDGLDQHPDNASLLYDIACVEAQSGAREAALEHLAAALAMQPSYRAHAARDEDLVSLQDDPRFAAIVGRTDG